MASQVSPGVVLKERELSNAVITGAIEVTAAFASTFAKGPIGEITSITTERELISTFGRPVDANAEDWLVASEFLNYGGRLSVVRAETAGVLNAANSGGVLIANDVAWQSGVGASKVLAARTAGTHGNSLLVVVVDRGADQLITLAGGWDNAPVVGSAITFNLAGGGTKTGVVHSWDAGTGVVSVVLDDPTVLITTSDKIEDGNEIGTFTVANPGPDATRAAAVGSYVAPGVGGSGGGATFNVTVNADGSVNVVLLADGDNYANGDALTISDAAIGNSGAADLTILITSLDPDTTITAVADWYTNTEIGSTGLTLGAIAPRPGTSAFAAARGLKYDEVHVAVIDTTGDVSGAANTVLERLTYLSKLTDAKSDEGASIYFKEVINAESSYIFHGAAPTVTQQPSSAGGGVAWNQASSDLSSGDAFLLSLALEVTLTGGADAYGYSSGEIGAAYDLFADTETVDINFVLMGGSMGTEVGTTAKAQKVLSIASGRKDCVAFVSPHKGNQIGTSTALTTAQQKVNTINFFNQLASTSYGVFDSGYKYFYDRFNDKYRWLPCNADVAGLCVATSATLDDWFSPAGLNRGAIRNAIKLAYNPTKADRDELYQVRINPIVTFPGTGTVLFGDKTALASPSAFDRINVRRLFLNIEARVETLAKGVLFELNDTTTRALFSSAVNSYLNEVQARRGVTDFLVVCDESNNTPDVIDRNEFVAELFIKPTRSINYVTITFTATKTGVSFSEVVGR